VLPKTISVVSQRLIKVNHPSSIVVGFVKFPHEVQILVHDTGFENFFLEFQSFRLNLSEAVS
jgi:hypothetical protein